MLFTKILMECSLEWPILIIFQTIIKYLVRIFLQFPNLQCHSRSVSWLAVQLWIDPALCASKAQGKRYLMSCPVTVCDTPVGRGNAKFSWGPPAQTRKVTCFFPMFGWIFHFPPYDANTLKWDGILGASISVLKNGNNFCAFVKYQPKNSDETSQKLPKISTPPLISTDLKLPALLSYWITPPKKHPIHPIHPSSHPPPCRVL